MNNILMTLEFVGIGLITLLPLTNPLSTVVLFLGLSSGMSVAEQKRQILRASFYVFCIMICSFYAGSLIMNVFGISIPGLRIAGGLIVAIIGLRMLFSQGSASDSPEVEDKTQQMRRQEVVDISFVPLAMPVTAGPGTIAMIIAGASSLKSGVYDVPLWLGLGAGPILLFLSISFLIWICLRCAEPILKRVGKGAIEAISRLMGFLLVCIGVQFVINGTLEVVTQMDAPEPLPLEASFRPQSVQDATLVNISTGNPVWCQFLANDGLVLVS